MNENQIYHVLVDAINKQAFAMFCKIHDVSESQQGTVLDLINDGGEVEEAFKALRSQIIKDLDKTKDQWMQALSESLANYPH